MNLLQVLHHYGQSIWLDGFERGWISGGGLQRYIEEDGLKGVRSNFRSLQTAIAGENYNRDFTTLAQQGISQTAQSDYDYLMIRDLQLAADLLKPVHSQTQGHDGYVQIDLPPDQLLDVETAIASAQSIWQSVGWSNLLLRIPAIPLLLPVIEQLIGDHINVNAILVFSSATYEQVFDGYRRGLEKLIQQGEVISDVVCFASVSMDSLNAVIHPFMANSEISFSVIQARLLYRHYRQLCQSSDNRRSLPEGVKPLRLVWDCTSISSESAWLYLQQLAFPETKIMLSPSILEMYRGVSLLPNHWADSEQASLVGELGEHLLDEQVERLVDAEMARSLTAFRQLLDTIEHKRIR